MGYRKFHGPRGEGWEVRDDSRREWRLVPIGSNQEGEKRVTAPTHTDDPFELSEEELQKMLEGGRPRRGAGDPSTLFKDG